MSSVPQWNADIVTPEAPEAEAEIQANGGLEKDAQGALGVKVDGDTVTINSEGELEAVGGGSSDIPSYSSSDANKVLKVDSQGEDLVWGTAGGSYSAGNGIDITNDEISVKLGSGGIRLDTNDNTLMIADDYSLVYVDDGAIKVRHDSTISETVDNVGNYTFAHLGVANPVPTPGSSDANKVLTVSDAQGNYGWASQAGGLPSYTSSDWGKVLSVKQASQGSSSSVVYWASAIPGGQTLGSGSRSSAGTSIDVSCDVDKSYLYNLVCIVPNLSVDTTYVDKLTDYYLDLSIQAGMYTFSKRMCIKFADGIGSGVWSDSSQVAYVRGNSVSSISISSLTKTDGTSVTGNWLLSGSSIYVYGIA